MKEALQSPDPSTAVDTCHHRMYVGGPLVPDLLDLAERRFGESFAADADDALGDSRRMTHAGADAPHPYAGVRAAWQEARDRSRSAAAYVRSPGFAKVVRQQLAASVSARASVIPGTGFTALSTKGGSGRASALPTFTKSGVRLLH